MITVIGLVVLLPFMLWAERSQRFRMLSPLEQNLQRASHGAALIVFVLLVLFSGDGAGDVLHFFPKLVADPGKEWPVAVLAGGSLLYGAARFIVGVRRSWGMRDGLLALRALVKLAIGGLVTFYLWRPALYGRFAASEDWVPFAVLAVFLVGIWCLVTGVVRLLLLTVGGGGSPRRLVEREIRQTTVVFRPVGSRPWWRFW